MRQQGGAKQVEDQIKPLQHIWEELLYIPSLQATIMATLVNNFPIFKGRKIKDRKLREIARETRANNSYRVRCQYKGRLGMGA